MAGQIGSDREVTVTASCGHKTTARVHGSGRGPASVRNVARNQGRPCYNCRQEAGAVVTVEQQAAKLSDRELSDLVAECEYNLWGAGQVTGHTLWNAFSDRRTAAKAELARR